MAKRRAQMRKRSTPGRAATHAAGHLLMAALTGQPVPRVVEPAAQGCSGCRMVDSLETKNVESVILCILGGPVAEEFSVGRTIGRESRRCSSDFARAAKLASSVAQSPDGHEVFMEWMEIRTRDMILSPFTDHRFGVHLGSLKRLARAVEQGERLSARDVARLVYPEEKT